jgi:two-component system, NarL family, response regulator DesR
VTANPAIRVLLADDQADVVEMLRYALSVYGSFEVVGCAGDGLKAVELARAASPDVAVIDLMMPLMNGFEAISMIRTELPEIRLVVLSAIDDPASRRLASEAGADLFLVKGAVPREIAELLADLVLGARQGMG